MKNKLLKSTSVVSFMTLLSRIMGFVRDMVFATMFGATLGFDAFLLAFKIPNFFRRLFAEGAFSQAFVPVLAQYKGTRSHEEVKQLVHKVSGNLALVLGVVTLLGVVFAPAFVMIFAPGFEPDGTRFELACQMLRITFPYLMFISLTALAGGVLNTYQKFSVPAFTPVMLNISLILSALYLSQYTEKPIIALAWGVFMGGLVQLCLQFPFLKKIGFSPKLVWDWKDEGVRKILKLMLPAMIGASVMQINLLVDTLFASFLPVGSLSWLYYADRIIEFPLGMFGVALATVALPNLAHHFATKNEKAFNTQCQWALKMCLTIGVPSAIGLWALSLPVMATLFGHGAFLIKDIEMASLSLRMLGFGLIAFMLVKVMVSAFYARQNTVFPVKVAIVSLLSNIVLNAILIQPLAHAGLSLASSLSAVLQVVLLGWMLARQGHLKGAWAAFLARVSIAGICMGGALIWATPHLSQWLTFTLPFQALYLFGLIAVGGCLYGATLWVFGLRLGHLMPENA